MFTNTHAQNAKKCTLAKLVEAFRQDEKSTSAPLKKANGHTVASHNTINTDEPFDTANCEVIKTMSNKNKKKLNYDLKVWEAIEIKKHNCGPGRGLNEDWGAYVKTDAWNPVFSTMD